MTLTRIGLAACLLALCAGQGAWCAPPTGPLGVLGVSGAADRGFARALAVHPFEFPRDAGPHPAYRHEWWYWTGHLRARDGERFGFELTFFRIALTPPATQSGAAAGARSRWRARQIYVAHFAVTDISRGTFHSTARYEREALGLAGAQASPFRVWLGGWSVTQEDAPGVRILRAADSAYGLRLRMQPLMAPVLNGDHGLSIKSRSPWSASDYYSVPRVAVRGEVIRGGQVLEVSGTAWLDREWGSGGLGRNEAGWDWFALQLDDGSDLMFYVMRDRDGAPDPVSAGTWVGKDGHVRALSDHDVRIDVLGHWTSPNGTRYPSGWRVRAPSLGLDVTLQPVLKDQELDVLPRYWEGDVDVSGTRDGHALAGQGYVELVGYGKP